MHADLDDAAAALGRASFDVCIFGTGPAGLTVALELANTGKRIALIEAGGFDYTEESQKFYDGTETGLNTWNALKLKRLRYFGGSSGHWTGRCGLFDEIDFSGDNYHGLPGWPIGRSDVLSHLPRAAEILDLGQQGLATKPIKDGVDSSFVHSSRASSPPTRFGQKYRGQTIESSNIQLLTRANLTELRLGARSAGNASIDHAVLKNYKGQTYRLNAQRYVVALGAVENARLLLNSDKQVPGGIGNHAGYVGRCFMEHLNVQMGRFVVRDKSYFSAKQSELAPTRELLQSLRVGNGVLAAHPSFVPIDYGRLRYFKRVFREGVCEFETMREYARKFNDFNCAGEGVITSLIEQCPNPDSRVSLTSDTDALGLRKANLHWVINDTDRRTIRTLAMALAKEFARLDAARVKLSDFILDTSKPIPVSGHAHHMGTTRMSSDPRHGVVDENCKVHGVANLYIAGSSVFPTGGGTNPTLTIVLLALRLGKHLRQLT
jgi:choline dehydrogenase-like flavoprotein